MRKRRRKNHITNIGPGRVQYIFQCGLHISRSPSFQRILWVFQRRLLAVIHGVNCSRILLQSQWTATFIWHCGIFQSNGSTCVCLATGTPGVEPRCRKLLWLNLVICSSSVKVSADGIRTVELIHLMALHSPLNKQQTPITLTSTFPFAGQKKATFRLFVSNQRDYCI